MSVMELGAIGEFVGAIAVVATLIFLSFQVRHSWKAMEENTQLARAASHEQTFAHFSQQRGWIINSPEVARIWHEGGAGRELDEIDQLRFDQLGQEFIFGLASSFRHAVASENMRLVRELPFVVADRVHNEPGMRRIWDGVREIDARIARRFGAKPDFADAVDGELEALIQEQELQ